MNPKTLERLIIAEYRRLRAQGLNDVDALTQIVGRINDETARQVDALIGYARRDYLSTLIKHKGDYLQ